MSKSRKKLIRITTVPLSLDKILDGQLSFMNDHYEVIAVSSEKEYLIRCATNEGVRYKHIEMTRKITPLKDLRSLINLIFFLIKEKPLIIHSHTPKAGILAMLASKIANVPIRLHTVGGLPLMEETGRKKKLLEVVEKLTYSLSTFIFTNSSGLYKHILENNYISRNKIKVIGNGSSNGVDVNYFSPSQVSENQKLELKSSLGILEDDFTFVFVGRIVTDKGINELVAAFNNISLYSKPLKLLLVGEQESDLDPLHKSTLEILTKNDQIIQVGFQRDIRPYLAISNVLVFPSYREGFPNVVMQAGAMGLPAIASDINGCNEIITHGENGILIPKKNTAKIEIALLLLKNNEKLYEKLKSNARYMIASRFERKVICETILEEYKSMEKSL
jgi:glycosyltransferase involved in cell wall biosynthesis